MFAPTAILHGSDASRTNIGATTSKAVYNVWGGTPRHPARLFAALLGITTVSSVCVFWYVSGFKCICIPVFRLCKLVTSACATLVSENKKQILARYVPGCLGVKDSNEEDLPFLARPQKKHDYSPQESHESDWTTESDEGEAIDNKAQKGRVTKTITNELEGVEEFYESSEHREALRMFMQHLSQPNVEKGKKKGAKKVVYHDHQDDENEEIIELTEATRITGKGYPKTVQRTNHEAAEEMFDSAFEEELLEEFLGDYINQRFADLHDEHGENEWEDVMEPYLFGYNEDDANGFLPQGDWSDLEEMGGGDEFESIVQQLWGSTSADPHQINYHSGNGSDRLFR